MFLTLFKMKGFQHVRFVYANLDYGCTADTLDYRSPRPNPSGKQAQ